MPSGMVRGMKAAAATGKPPRQPWVDALRGVAMLWMTGFHFCFDLNHFGYWRQEFLTDPFWLTQRTMIVSLFLCCAGWGQALAMAQQPRSPGAFWRRWTQIVACAGAVSIGSWIMFPASYISFGVLHGVAVMLLVLRGVGMLGAGRHPLWLVGLIGTCLLLPALAAQGLPTAWAEHLNGRAWNWLGLITVKPVTEDYVPLLPWLGVVLGGFWIGNVLLQRGTVLPALPRVLRPLATLGRWPLSYYMLHQPVLLGALVLVGFASKG